MALFSLGLLGSFEVRPGSGSTALAPGKKITVKAGDKTFTAICRIDTPNELDYYRNGGILHYVLRQLAKA